jgi:hemin uptake protein HemP
MRTPADPPLSKQPGPASSGGAPLSLPVAVKSEALFVGGSEVLIDHRGVMYRLRLTSLGKLILTK